MLEVVLVEELEVVMTVDEDEEDVDGTDDEDVVVDWVELVEGTELAVDVTTDDVELEEEVVVVEAAGFDAK